MMERRTGVRVFERRTVVDKQMRIEAVRDRRIDALQEAEDKASALK